MRLADRGPSGLLGTVRHRVRCLRRGWLEAVLEAYALTSYHPDHHGTELAAFLHRGMHVALAQQQLIDLIRDLLTETC
jgi:hypothetical protein